MKKIAEAHLKSLTPKQITTLRYIQSKGTIILERAHEDMKVPKSTLGHRLQRLERLDLIETRSVENNKIKPRQLTVLAEKVLALLEEKNKGPLDIEDLPKETRKIIKQARIEAQTIITRLDPGHIYSWNNLLENLEYSLRQARINAKLFSPAHKRATT